MVFLREFHAPYALTEGPGSLCSLVLILYETICTGCPRKSGPSKIPTNMVLHYSGFYMKFLPLHI